MTTTRSTETEPAATSADTAALAGRIRVSVPEHNLRSDLRAVSIVWRRELIRFRRDRLRAVTSLIQPLLFLLVLGTGLSSLAKGSMPPGDRKSTRLNSSHVEISYAVFCLKKKKKKKTNDFHSKKKKKKTKT